MNYHIPTNFALICLLPGCGLVSGSAREDAPLDPVQTYEAFGRSLEPLALDGTPGDATAKSGRSKTSSGLGRLEAGRRKTWLQEEREAMALAKANAPDDILGTDRTSRLARGLALYKERKLEGARETYLDLLQEEEAYFPARRNLGEVSLSLEEWEPARDAFEIVHTQLGSGPRTDSDLGLVLLLFFPAEAERGRELLAKHVADEERGMRNLEQVVTFDFRAQHPDRAEPIILQAARAHQSPGDTNRLALLLAMAQYRQGKFDQAGPLLLRLANFDWPGQGTALVNLFQVQRSLSMFEDAQKTLERLKSPRFVSARRVLATSEARMESLTQQVAAELQAGKRLRPIALTEIVIDLIYEPRADRRRATLMQIQRWGLKTQARFYEFSLTRDKDPEIRRLAYLLLAKSYPDNRTYLEMGMKDPDPRVRKVAIDRLVTLPEIEAKDSLFRALERENDPDLFLKLHQALCQCCNDTIFLEPGEDSSEAGREKRRLFWAKKLDIVRSNRKEGAFIERDGPQPNKAAGNKAAGNKAAGNKAAQDGAVQEDRGQGDQKGGSMNKDQVKE